MEKLYEVLGRKQVQLEAQDAAYANLLALLSRVVSGEVDRSRLLVNMTDRTWELVDVGQRPAMPATINGLPVCVVAPDPPVTGSQNVPTSAADPLPNGGPQ